MSNQDQNYLCTREGQVVGPFTQAQLGEMKRSGEMQAYFWLWEASNPQWAPANPPPPPPSAPTSPIASDPDARTAELNPSEEMGGTSTVVMPSQPARQYARFDNRGEFSSTATSRDVTTDHYVPPEAFGFDDDEDSEVDTPKVPDRPQKSKRPHAVQDSPDVRSVPVVAHNKRSVINGSLQNPTSVGALLVGPAPRERMSGPFVRGSKIWLNLLDLRSGKTENVEAQVIGMMRRGTSWEYRVKWDRLPEILDAA